MEGNRRITLFKPAEVEGDPEGPYGDRPAADPTEYIRFVERHDRTGRESLTQGAVIGEWNTRFRVRTLGLQDITSKWWIVDEDGREYDIESISEDAPGDPRRRRWWLNCVART